MTGKAVCRRALLESQGMDPQYCGPVFGMVCRLAEQKGIDLLLANGSFFEREDCRLIVLGTGAERYERGLRDLAASAGGKVTLCLQLDEKMSHLIEAGSDFFLMPSLFEPCGLNQMYSQAYGTIPLTSQVGGLVDTVVDADAQPQTGTGLTFPATDEGLRDALHRALRLFADKKRLSVVQKRGMSRDFGWKQAAGAYEQLYQDSL